MAYDHPENIDPRPKRRRDKDNPYEIFTVGIETGHPHYYIRFKDSLGIEQCMEIAKELFDLFDRFELDDLSFLNEVDRHYDLSDQSEETLNSRALVRPCSLEDALMERLEQERLRQAITMLPDVQKRRLILYYFGGLTYQEIAQREGCRYQVVQRSIWRAEEKIKKYLL